MDLLEYQQIPLFSIPSCTAKRNIKTALDITGSSKDLDLITSKRWELRTSLASERSEETVKKENYIRKRKLFPWANCTLDEALALLDSSSIFEASVEDLVNILQKCRRKGEPSCFLRLLAHIRAFGHEADPCLGNDLVSALAEAGHVDSAQQVFDRLEVRSRSSCNSLIACYIKHGQSLLALRFYQCLGPDDLQRLSIRSFVALIKACTKSNNLKLGSQIHAFVSWKGLLQGDKYLGSALVDMYAKCGKLSEAEELFNSLSARDVVSWNALISGYVRHGFGEEALKLFQKMQLEGCKPTAVTFVSCLKACTLLKDMDQCQIFDAEVRSNGLEHDPFVGIALIDMHAKCGFLERAEEAFQELPTRNVVSWTALMKGYIDHGRAEQALTCFEKMQEEGVSPDAAAFLCALKSCSRTGNIVMGQKLHADISRMSVERDHLLDCALVDMYCKFGLLNKAQEIFMELPTKDVMLWNTLMGGFIDHGQGDKALWCYDQMLQNDICLSSVSFVLGLKACGNLLDIQKGKEIHVEVCKRDLERDLHVGSTLVDMYSKCGALEIAQEVFDKLSSQDVVSWTSLIGGYTDHGKGLEALIRFKLMQDEGIAPNAVTFSCILKACGNEGAVRKGRETHAMIAKTELLEKESIVGSALVYMYAKCGLPARAKEAFDVEAVQDIITRNVLIAGYAQLGECGTALNILNEMIGEGEKPTPVTFVSILNACSHAGLVDLGLMCFDRMKTDFSMVPSVEHHTCVIDLLCRAGQIENALSLINEMQISPDLAIWHSLLGACQQGGNVELGKHAFEHAVHIDGLDATAYVSWSNVYHDDEG